MCDGGRVSGLNKGRGGLRPNSKREVGVKAALGKGFQAGARFLKVRSRKSRISEILHLDF